MKLLQLLREVIQDYAILAEVSDQQLAGLTLDEFQELLSHQYHFCQSDWNESDAVKDRLKSRYLSLLTEPEALICALAALYTGRHSKPMQADLNSMKQNVLHLMKTRNDASFFKTVINWKLAWTRAEIAELPHQFITTVMNNLTGSVSFKRCGDDFDAKIIEFSPEEQLLVTLMHDRPVWAEDDLSKLFQAYVAAVHPKLLHLPCHIKRFSARRGHDTDLLAQLSAHYRERLTPAIQFRRDVQILREPLFGQIRGMNWSPTMNLFTTDIVHIEAPHMSCLFPAELDICHAANDNIDNLILESGTDYTINELRPMDNQADAGWAI